MNATKMTLQRMAELVLLSILVACTSTPASVPPASPAPAEDLATPEVSPTVPSGPTVVGRVVEGYGDHQPIPGLPLWLGQTSSGDPVAETDSEGRFELRNLPVDRMITVNSSHLDFRVTLTSAQTVDLGTLKYPLTHPYNYYYWSPYPLRDPAQLTAEGEALPFTVCKQETAWQRPTEALQREHVWSQLPFRERGEDWLRAWFQRPAALYDTIDLFRQSFPGGPRLDDVGADHVYLIGLWTAESGPLEASACPYTPEALEALLERNLIEVWLLGYQATEVRRLSMEDADLDEDTLCAPQERTCTLRPGTHYAVRVEPAQGYQVIRFAGRPAPITVHVLVEGEKLAQLP